MASDMDYRGPWEFQDGFAYIPLSKEMVICDEYTILNRN